MRFGQRVATDVQVGISVDDHVKGRGTIRNASISGALIATNLELPLHTNVVVTVTIPGRVPAVTHTLPACVVRLDPIGLGIEWRDMGGIDIVDLLDAAS